MCFNVSDGVGFYSGIALGLGNNRGLPLNTGSCISHLCAAVVVHGETTNDSMDLVPAGEGIFEALEHNHADASTKYRSLSIGVKGAAVTVRRAHPPILIEVSALLRKGERHPAREHHVALLS